MLTLPTAKGEDVIVWSDYERDADGPVRVVVTSDGRGRWSMQTEEGVEPEGDNVPSSDYYDGAPYTWVDGAAFRHNPDSRDYGALFRVMIDMLLALRGKYVFKPEQKIKAPSIRDRGENIVSKTKGNKCLVVTEHGGHCDGGSLMGIHSNKPLDAGEWATALEALAHALDAYAKWWEGES